LRALYWTEQRTGVEFEKFRRVMRIATGGGVKCTASRNFYGKEFGGDLARNISLRV